MNGEDTPVAVPMWTVEEDSGTGPNDEGYFKWWTVSDGQRSLDCHNAEDATWFANVLNAACAVDQEPRPLSHLLWERLKIAVGQRP